MPQLTRISKTELWGGGASDAAWQGRPVLCDDGTNWICVYRSSSVHGPNADGHLHIRFSDDEGDTWTAEDTKIGGGAVTGFPVTGTGSNDTGEALLMVAPTSGDIIMHYIEHASGVTNGTYQMISDDGGDTWGSATQINTDQTFQGAQDYVIDGTTIYISAFDDVDTNKTAPYKSYVYKSTNDGSTWTHVGDITTTTDDTSECAIEKTDTTDMIAFCRALHADETTWTATSTDTGASWTQSSSKQPWGKLYKPRLRYDGSRLILWGRQNYDDHVASGSATSGSMVVWYSDDDGSTWHGPLFPEQTPWEDCAYGDWLKKADGSFYMVTYGGTGSLASVYALVWKFGDDAAVAEAGTFVSPAGTNNAVVKLSKLSGITPAACIFLTGVNWYDALGTAGVGIIGFGVSDGTREAYICGTSQTSNTMRRHSNTKACGVMSAGSGSILQEFDCTLGSGQITAAFTTNGTSTPTLYKFLAIGGTGVQAYLQEYSADTSTGDQTLTNSGSFEPTAAILFGVNNATAAPDLQTNACQFQVAVTDGTTQRVMGVYSQDTVTPGNSWKLLADQFYTTMASGGEIDNADIALTAGGGTLTWNNAPSSAHKFWVLWLAGVTAEVVVDTQKTSAGDKATTTTNQPDGILFLSAMDTSSASEQNGGDICIGVGDENNSGSNFSTEQDAANNRNNGGSPTYALITADYSDNIDARGRVTALGATSFTLTWDTADATAREFAALAIGAIPSISKIINLKPGAAAGTTWNIGP